MGYVQRSSGLNLYMNNCKFINPGKDPMSTFEFITVLLSIVIGLGITQLLGGIGRAIEVRIGIRLYWVQMIWVINVGFYMVLFWWGMVFSYSNAESILLLNLINLLFYTILLFLQAVLIIPGKIEKCTDLQTHYFTIRPWFFLIGALIPVTDLFDCLIHGIETLLSFGLFYIISQVASIAGNIAAAITRNRLYHAIWCIVYLIGLL